MPGTGRRGGGCLGGAAGHPGDPVGRGTGAGKGMAGATAVVTNSGCMPFGGGSCGRIGGAGAGNTPVVGTAP